MKNKEIFIETIMDLLIAIDLDNVSENKEKENRMRKELMKMNYEELNDKYNQAYEIFKTQQDIEIMDKVIKEVEEIGVEAVKEKYGLN